MICGNDDVAEWDGGAWGPEQRLDEADGHRPQGAPAPRLGTGLYGQDFKPVSKLASHLKQKLSSTALQHKENKNLL